MNKELLEEAIEIFGNQVVYEVREVVELSDPDGAWSTFQDMGKWDHAECVEFMYLVNNY